MTPSGAATPCPFQCLAVVAPGLEGITAEEIAGLGMNRESTEPGGVTFRATAAQLYTANLRLRTSSRVTVRLAEFHARVFSELQRHAARLPWDRFLAPGSPVQFQVTSKKSKLYHAGAVEQRLLEVVEKAVGAEEAREAEPVRGQNPQLFIVRLFRDQCTISVDSSGELLHRRGYREQGGKAPLRETLAAAMLLACGWNGETPLLDPLCGSGTIVIEAALLARRIPPGLKRAFAFQDWPEFDAVAWRTVREDAEAGVLPACPAPLLGSDRDAGAIRAAIANSERAGVLGDIGFRRAALSAIEPPVGAGWILTNPPYGVRVGDRLRLRDLYAQLGNVARKRCAGWMVGMLSADSMLEAQTGLAFQERFRTKNGGIGVRLVTASVPAQQ